MKSISISDVKGWDSSGNIFYPTNANVTCPICGHRGVFTFGKLKDDPERLTTSFTSSCPWCSNPVYFWVHRKNAVSFSRNCIGAVCMYPDGSGHYKPVDLGPNVPEALAKSLNATIDSLASRNFTATAVLARRTLEGIFKYLVAPEKRSSTLYTLIDTATKEADLAAPLKALSHAIRGGGNLGAHFDEDNEPTEEMAKQMVELLNYLITFLYVLPDKIQSLEKTLDATSSKPAEIETVDALPSQGD